jgi:hypothetical protein
LLSSIDLTKINKLYDGRPDGHAVGLIRDIMIISDADRYFKRAFKKRWGGMDEGDVSYLADASGRSDIGQLLVSHGVELLPNEWGDGAS